MPDWLPIDIAASAMAAERLRMNAAASNMANVNSTRTPEGGPYRPLQVVFQSQPPASFQDVLADEMKSLLGEGFSTADQAALAQHLRGVSAWTVQSTRQPELRYEPSHPDADANGMVAYPNVSPIEEMTNLISASRIYEANASTIKLTKEMLDEVLQALRV
ncbi:MAG: flagellar basal body rod protein FlgC [Candidatus Sumerlaeota bacterium]|nr:flagellar basal body rod protein FlgC [Candidatus Sumerlaeota bacterium]